MKMSSHEQGDGGASVASDAEEVLHRLAAATKKEYSDVFLVSDADGSAVPAVRFLLASCSDVFARMLFGDFSEGNGSETNQKRAKRSGNAREVRSAYQRATLKAVVAFSVFNDAPLLHNGTAAELVELLEAGNYYGIEVLRAKANKAMLARVTSPVDACSLLNAALEHGKGRNIIGLNECACAALATLERQPEEALNYVFCLSEPALKVVLSSPQIAANEEELFIVLQRWCNAQHADDQTAKQLLASCLSLERMSPTFLRDVVRPTGWASQEALVSAFQAHSLAQERVHGCAQVYQRSIGKVKWRSTGTPAYSETRAKHGVELLDDCHVEGKWTWTLKVELDCSCWWAGVIRGDAQSARFSSSLDMNDWLGKQPCGYVYGSNGSACHATGVDDGPYNQMGPEFTTGSKLVFTLDCEEGTLSVSVDNNETFKVFEGMRQDLLPGEEYKGFTPAVSLRAPGKVQMLQMRSLSVSSKVILQ